jgi:hypothetical protein
MGRRPAIQLERLRCIDAAAIENFPCDLVDHAGPPGPLRGARPALSGSAARHPVYTCRVRTP